MLRVLIVDDEKTTRETLRDCIPWSTVGLEMIGTANNGKQALDFLAAQRADILVSDIRMPKMDGLALANEVHRLYPECAIIFLSGYSDKDYLKTAIKLHAVDYVEKPISVPELISVLEKAKSQVDERQLARERMFEAREMLARVEPLRRQAFCAALIAGNQDELKREYNPGIYDAFCPGPLRAGIIWTARSTPASPDNELTEIILASLNGAESRNVVASRVGSDRICFLADSSLAADSAAFETRIAGIAGVLFAIPGAQNQLRIGISPVLSSYTEIPLGIERADAAVSRMFYEPSNRIFYYRDRNNRRFEVADELVERFSRSLTRRSPEELKTIVTEAAVHARQVEDEDHERVRKVFSDLGIAVLAAVPALTAAERTLKSEQFCSEIGSASTVARLSDLVNAAIDRYVAVDFHELAAKKKIERAKNFIHEAYGDFALAVEDVAKKVALSESYLCTLFKQETGSTVREFILSVRLEKAKELLREDNDKLLNVAKKSGFKNADYFSVVFRKETGLTPGEYRGLAAQ